MVLSGGEPIALTFDGGLVGGNFVGAEGAGDTNPSSIVAAVSFASAFTFGNQNDFGADGPGATTISYALQFAAGFVEGSLSGLASDGVAVRLYQDASGNIVGSTALTEGGVLPGNTVFTIAVNTSTGLVTLTQSAPIDHSQTDTYNGAYINDLAQLANGQVVLRASAVTTDDEGDTTGVASANLDLGGNVRFGDDGPGNPTVVLSGGEPIALTFDGGLGGGNFVGAEGAGDTNPSSIVAAVSFASAFTFGNQNDFGADGPGATTISYALQFAAGFVEGSLSGLASDGVAVRLYQDASGNIVGSTALTEGGVLPGNTVFTIAVNTSTGLVTLTQSAPIDHSQTDTYNGAYINDLAQLANGQVVLRASAVTTDDEGDTTGVASANLDLGGNVRFGDDGPGNPTVVLSGGEPIALTFDGGLGGGNFVGAEGAGDTNPSSIVAAVSFASAFTFGNQNDFGADGPGATTISYALQFAAGFVEGSLSGLASDGVAVRLYQDASGNIVGSTALTEGGVLPGNTVFTIAVNTSTGLVTLTQSAPIDHSQTDTYNGAYINDLAQLANGQVVLRASAVTTDDEGDTTGVASANLDLGGNVRFGDDGPGNPTVVLSGGEPIALTFDGGLGGGNFVGAEGAGDTNPSSIVAAVSFASAFTFGNQNDFGADGPGATTISYALQFAAGFVEGSLSGLASDGVAVRLYQDASGNIVGSTALTEGGVLPGNTVFTIAVNTSTGLVTLTQSAPIDHSQTDTYNGAYINDLAQLANGQVVLRASAVTTDDEGDTTGVASANLDLGGNVRFGDDGPGNPTVVLSGGEPIALTFDGGLGGGNFVGAEGAGDTNPSSIVAAVSFASAFTFGNQNDFGADGPGATTISYALQFAAGFVEGSLSGLASDGVAVRLYQDASGNIVGSTALTEGGVLPGNTVFTIAVNTSTGLVTLTQSAPIDHSQTDTYNGAYINDLAQLANGQVVLRASAVTTDDEGDTTGVASANLDLGGNVRFGDDGPEVNASTDITLVGTDLSGSGIFNYDVGADDRVTFSIANTDFGIVLSGTVGSTAIVNPTVIWAAESATSATFNFTFQYDADPTNASNPLTNETGTIVFDKVANTYTVTLNEAIETFTTVSTGQTISRDTYNIVGSSASQPEIVVSELASDFFVRFTAIDGGVTSPPAPTGTWAPGESFAGSQGWVSSSGTENGVSSDTLQNGEVLNLQFYTSDPGGTTTPGFPTARADSIFLKLDQLGNSEDFVVILQLIDPDDNSLTTRAVVVDRADIWESGQGNPLGLTYVDINGDPIDGIIVIESNDFNILPGENWQIYGAQLMTSTNGITSAANVAVDLNKAVGALGGSLLTDEFDAATSDSDVIKVVDIGFVRQTVNTQEVHLDFDVTITDSDTDKTTVTTLSVNPIVPPVALDLDGDGLEFVGTAAGVAFDYNGDGVRESTAWTGPDDGMLVHDANGDSAANNGSEIVFSVNGSTDLEGLRQTYDSNGDGQLTAADAGYASFGVWQDANSNGVTDAGEYRTLSEAGIVSIDLVANDNSYTAANGQVLVHGESSYAHADGSQNVVGDVSFATRQAEAQKSAAQAMTTQSLTSSLVAASLVASVGAGIRQASFDADPDAHLVSLSAPVSDASAEQSLGLARGETHEALADHLSPQHEAIQSSGAPEAATSPASEPAFHAQVDGWQEAIAPSEPQPSIQFEAAVEIQPAIGGMMEMAAMPIIPEGVQLTGPVAAAAGSSAELGAVLADALHQSAGPDINALLDALPVGSGAAGGTELAAMDAGAVAMDWASFGMHQVFDMAVIAHDTATAVQNG